MKPIFYRAIFFLGGVLGFAFGVSPLQANGHVFESFDLPQIDLEESAYSWFGDVDIVPYADAHSGEYVLSVGNDGGGVLYPFSLGALRYADIWIKASLETGDSTFPRVVFGKMVVAWERSAEGGVFLGLSVDGQETHVFSTFSSTPDEAGMAAWMRLTLWQDFSLSEPAWAIFVNGELALSGEMLPEGEPPQGLFVYGGDGELYLDDISLGDFNGLLENENGPANAGLLSMKMKAFSLSGKNGGTAASTKKGVLGYLLNSSSSVPTLQASALKSTGTTYYVNPTASDAYNGLSPTVGANGLGPKATLQAAISSAPSATLILLSPGRHILSGAIRSGGKNITIAPLSGDVVISGN